MLGTVEVRVTAGHPNMPLKPIAVFAGSAATIGVLDVPRVKCGATITGIAIAIENADGTVAAVSATLVKGVWCATFGASHLMRAGHIENGVTITASGVDEKGDVATWTIGKGDIEILDAGGVPIPGKPAQYIRYCASVPEKPTPGDIASVSGVWSIFSGHGWIPLGRGVDLSEIQTIGDDYTMKDIKNTLNSILNKLSATLATIAVAVLPMFSAVAETVVTNGVTSKNNEDIRAREKVVVDVDAARFATTNQLRAAIVGVGYDVSDLSEKLDNALDSKLDKTNGTYNITAKKAEAAFYAVYGSSADQRDNISIRTRFLQKQDNLPKVYIGDDLVYGVSVSNAAYAGTAQVAVKDITGQNITDKYISTLSASNIANAAANGARMQANDYTRESILAVTNKYTEEIFRANNAASVAHDIAQSNKRDIASIRTEIENIDVSAQIEPIQTAVATATNSISSMRNEMNGIVAVMNGESVRLTVTNYDSMVHTPSLYIEDKLGEGGTWRTVWDERTRYNMITQRLDEIVGNLETNTVPSLKQWGWYDSMTGAESPQGILSISNPQIQIAPGASWQKTITTDGSSLWTLTANDIFTFSPNETNSFFRIQDAGGEPLFEIVKGDKRTVGAVSSGASMNGGQFIINYNVASESHPKLKLSTDLRSGIWDKEENCTWANVAWTGTSGAWVATVTYNDPKPDTAFAYATYERGGNTYIKNHVAASFEKIVIGGVEYRIAVETINGKKLMVLTEAE